MTIKLTDVAKNYNEKQHQINALNWLEANIPADVLDQFAVKYRTEEKPAVDF